jgi:hypothetical protein
MTIFQRMALGPAVALFALAAVANPAVAAPKSVTVASAITVSYNLVAGGATGPISLPLGIPVQVIGVQTAIGNRGVGQVSMLSPRVAPNFIEWVGLESTTGAAITQGFSAVLGTHIVFIDFAHTVDIEVAGPTTIRIHNSNGAAQTGTVTLIW